MLSVDFLLLADFAEVVNGKLYLQGGGWDRLLVGRAFPFQRNLGIAVGIDVPWDETNVRHAITLRVLNEDTQRELARVEGQVEAGRPAGMSPGQAQVVMMALNGVVTFEGAGQYLVTAEIDGEVVRRRPFRVEQKPGRA